MKGTSNSMERNNPNTVQKEQTVEVLYQKMGDRWFAFSLIDDEVFIGSITQNEIDDTETMVPAPQLLNAQDIDFSL